PGQLTPHFAAGGNLRAGRVRITRSLSGCAEQERVPKGADRLANALPIASRQSAHFLICLKAWSAKRDCSKRRKDRARQNPRPRTMRRVPDRRFQKDLPRRPRVKVSPAY